MSGIARRAVVAAASILSLALIPACGLLGNNSAATTESSHAIRDQCDRTLTFFENDLGIDDLTIGYGSIEPEDKIGRGATCTLIKASLVGVGETRLRAMLPNESEPASIKDNPNYIAQTGYDEKVWLNKAGGSVRIVTTVDGWQGTLDYNSDQINNVGEEPKFEVSDHQIRVASEFLIELTKSLTS